MSIFHELVKPPARYNFPRVSRHVGPAPQLHSQNTVHQFLNRCGPSHATPPNMSVAVCQRAPTPFELVVRIKSKPSLNNYPPCLELVDAPSNHFKKN